MNYYLAIDIGASSGRHILGWLEDGKFCYEEIYRFENGTILRNGHLCWDKEKIFGEILEGMKRCAEIGKKPLTVSVDTWGVDFMLLDRNDNVLGDAVSYRDHRTDGMADTLQQLISDEQLYERTGIQKASYNTIYQLMALRKLQPELLADAQTLLMTPDYYEYLLTGVKMQEYTIASTSGLISLNRREWDLDLIHRLGLPEKIFLPVQQPGTIVGTLKENIRIMLGYDCIVIKGPSHDTAAAVLAVPSPEDDFLYLSSGTWSLIGTQPVIPPNLEESRKSNFTNEGGYGNRYCFLKNISGLFLIQSIRKEEGDTIPYSKLCEMARQQSITSIIDCNDPSFLSPASMKFAIQTYCKKTEQQQPYTVAEYAKIVYHSLAVCYAQAINDIKKITGKSYFVLHIIGGGSNAEYLNQLTQETTGCHVIAGPSEATAIGNILAQMIWNQQLPSVSEARSLIENIV